MEEDQIFKFESISGQSVLFFVNEAGGMWCMRKDGQWYGVHVSFTLRQDIDDNIDRIELLRQNATKSIDALEEQQKNKL